MTVKVIVKESSINGLGVFALENIAKGELILAIDDSRVVTPEFPLDESKGELGYHCDYLAGGKIVLMQFPERHINHSCDPNTFVKTILGTRYVFALRPISIGEEVTGDYCINGFGDTLWQCNCGSARCRKNIHSDFFHLPYDLQIEYLPLLDSWYVEEYKEKVQELLEKSS
jgi:SET domain-containing protein